MKTNLFIWIISIALYVLNIVIISIFGATLFNNIAAWVCCIVLATAFILQEHYSKKMYERSIKNWHQWEKFVQVMLNKDKDEEKVEDVDQRNDN